MPTTFDLQPLASDEAAKEFDFYTDSGADVEVVPVDGGMLVLRITYPDAPPPAPVQDLLPQQVPPTQQGFVLCIDRIRCEVRTGAPSPRTVGVYQAFLDGKAIDGVKGYCVERQGPGDNSQSGVDNHRRIQAGTYPLSTHASVDTDHYKTIGYRDPGAIGQRPWPCLGVDDTGKRSGILVHCAQGYYMSIGCINLTDQVANASVDLVFDESRRRVIQLINAIKNTMQFPKDNNEPINGALLIVRGEPSLQVSDKVSDNSTNKNLAVPAQIDDNLRNAITAALRMNEIGDDSPYQLSFAKKGNSGASFGFMQGDLAAKQPIVQQAFHDVLVAFGVSADVITGLIARLSVHLLANPLTAQETEMVDKALLAGRKMVDAMDQDILSGVFDDLQQCIDTAAQANRHIDPKALIYMALWINMSGAPTKLLVWLSGGDPELGAPVQPAGPAVDEAAIESYLHATHYFIENAGNFAHLQASAAAGATTLTA
jgi:hypothetical protein